MKKNLVQTFVIVSMVSMTMLLFGCGKKGPLVMQPNLTPPAIANLEITQEGLFIKLKWVFPEELLGKVKTKDKKKKEFLLENIKKIHIYYSEKEILYGKFRKKSKLLRKLLPSDLKKIPIDTDSLLLSTSNSKKKTTSTDYDFSKKEKQYSYSIKIPFQLQDLENNKHHFFGVQYYYAKKKSLISKIVDIHTSTPTLPVNGLTLEKENKIVTLKWNRPSVDAAGNAITTIAGYRVYRKIEKEKTEENSDESDENEEPVFKPASKNNVLVEYFQEKDTGTNGKYTYYVTTVNSPKVESAPSEHVSIAITDTYPPEIPANLVTFKASDHMFLTWQEVQDLDFAKYKVYRRTTPEGEFTLLADDITSTQFKDKKVNPGDTYYYVVTAVDEKGNESEYSNIASERF